MKLFEFLKGDINHPLIEKNDNPKYLPFWFKSFIIIQLAPLLIAAFVIALVLIRIIIF
jgi:hypothetical protein